MYYWDLVSLIEEMFNGSKDAREKVNDILLYRGSYGNFTSPDNLLEAVDMLKKLETALSMSLVSNTFKLILGESIYSSYMRLDVYFKQLVFDSEV